jgi:uncharacterized protein YcfL
MPKAILVALALALLAACSSQDGPILSEVVFEPAPATP